MNVTLPLHRHALTQPEKPALIGERQTLSYRQLDQLAWRGAAYFRGAGLGPGDRVVLRVTDPVLHIVTGLALARLGVAYIALTPAEGPLMIGQLVQRIGARAVVSRAGTQPVRGCAELLVDAGTWSAGGNISGSLMCDDPDQFWLFRTTSGTTGKPKLLALSHSAFAKFLRTLELGVPTAASDIFLSLTRPYFYVAIAYHLDVLARGAVIVVPSTMAPDPLFSLMTRAGVNRVFVVPSVLQTLLQAPNSAAVVARLSVVTVSASVVPHSLREHVSKLTPGMMVLLACAEMGVLTSTWGMPGAWLRETVGIPVPYGELEIVDEAGHSLAPGGIGEIRVKRDGVVSNYFDDPAADQRFFRNGWFYPGDLACWSADGQMLFKGRADDMMIFDGINIFPTEIENCLQEHPCVVEAISFPQASSRHGDIPMAAVRLRAEVAEAELIGFCKERLGERYPRTVRIVDDFPRNAMGKPLKREMAELVAQATRPPQTA